MLDFALIVATFGSEHWREEGEKTAANMATLHDIDVFTVHADTLAAARNQGAEMSGKPWLCFLDADDALAPGYFQTMTDAIMATEPNEIHRTLYSPMLQEVHHFGSVTPARNLNTGRPLIDVNHCVVGTVISAPMFAVTGGFDEEPIYEDWALYLRCERHGASFVDVERAVYIATVREGSRNRRERAFAEQWYWKIRTAELEARQALAR